MVHRLLVTPDDKTLTLLRLGLGIMILAHGAQKMLGWFGGPGFGGAMGMFTGGMSIPAPLAFLAICTEFFGGIALILGLLGRIAAAGVAIEMIVAALLVHLPNGFFMNWSGAQQGEGFEFHILAVAIALATIIKGSGAYSIDRLIAKTETRRLPSISPSPA